MAVFDWFDSWFQQVSGGTPTPPGPQATAVLTDSRTTNGSADPITFTTVDFGEEAEDRIIVVAATFSSSNSSLEVTIGGVTASTVYQNSDDTYVGFFAAALPAGASGNVVLNPNTTRHVNIAVWAVYGSEITAYDTAEQSATNTNSLSIDVPAGGVLLVGARNGNTVECVITGVETDVTQTNAGSTSLRSTMGHREFANETLGHAVGASAPTATLRTTAVSLAPAT